MASIIFIV